MWESSSLNVETTPNTKKRSKGKYLYEDDKDVIEVTSEDGFFQTSTKPRIVEFYSPYCVSPFLLLAASKSFAHNGLLHRVTASIFANTIWQ